jgi:hypothetical protein
MLLPLSDSCADIPIYAEPLLPTSLRSSGSADHTIGGRGTVRPEGWLILRTRMSFRYVEGVMRLKLYL